MQPLESKQAPYLIAVSPENNTHFSYLALHTVTFYKWIVFPFLLVPQSFQDRGKIEIFNENLKKYFKQ